MGRSRSKTPLVACLFSLLGSAAGGSLADIEHVVLFMQENRAFDHYFGTMAGVRGFNDANLQVNSGNPVWNQWITPDQSTETKFINPWYINYLGGNWSEASQCMLSGNNAWSPTHAAYNGGLNDHWAMNNSVYSVGFYKRQDVPLHWTLAESFTVADMYQEAIASATNPNRVTWISGSINAPGSPQTPDQGGNPYLDNNETPGCDDGNFNCYPLKWKTTGEFYDDAGATWQVFQDTDNFDDNPYARFEQFQTLTNGSAQWNKAIKGLSLDTFVAQAANGTLPEISYIVGPMELSEHPPYAPNDGAWLQHKIAQAVLNSPKYNSTVLMISYDESGGWFDHVNPYKSPDGTAGEWIDDPYGEVGHTFIGPGYRLPFYIISPWTRNGGVFTAHSDHNSQIMFLEQWQAVKNRNVTTDQMVPWRRAHMSNLVDAFDFDHPDYSIPELPTPQAPSQDSSGNWNGAEVCQAKYHEPNPPVPFSGPGFITDMPSLVEKGFKPMRGMLTEGRHLVFERDGLALTHMANGLIGLTPATAKHDSPAQQWFVNAKQIGGDRFTIAMTANGSTKYICTGGFLCGVSAAAIEFTVGFKAGKGYSFAVSNSKQGYLAPKGKSVALDGGLGYWKLFSVNY